MNDTTHVLSVAQQQVAQRIQDFLKQHQIPSDIRYSDEQWQLHVQLASQREPALKLVKQWLEQIQKRQADQLWQHGAPVKQARKSANWDWRKGVNNLQQQPLTWLVLIICTLLFAAAFSLWYTPVREALRFAPWSELQQSGQWWRLLAPAFMHFSLIHIAFNLLWWWILGGLIERRFGSSSLFILLLVTALMSNFAQYLDTGSDFGGLSGVVYGLFGFVWWIGWLRPEWRIGLPNHLIGFMLVWLALGYTNLLPVNMANTAHLVGLIAGCGLAASIAMLTRRQS